MEALSHPVMMVKVLLYGYTNGVTSSRRLAAMLEVDVAFRYLAANEQPDHRTINAFRSAHREALEGLFLDVLELCQGAGLVKLGRVALDGHRVAGNATQSENRKRAKLEEEVKKLPEDARANRTDPESRVLKARNGGWLQGYNGQAMVDCESQVIVAQALTHSEADVQLLGPMLARCEAQAGARPAQLLADAGYWSEANGALDGEGGTELLIATVHRPKDRKDQHPRRDQMEVKLESEVGKAAYRQRCSTIEPVFGQMVMRGLERFRLRGKAKVQLEWSLWCTTHNLLKLWRSAKRVQGGRIAVATRVALA